MSGIFLGCLKHRGGVFVLNCAYLGRAEPGPRHVAVSVLVSLLRSALSLLTSPAFQGLDTQKTTA